MASIPNPTLLGAMTVLVTSSLFYILYANNYIQPLPATRLRSEIQAERSKQLALVEKEQELAEENTKELSALPFQKVEAPEITDDSAWRSFSTQFDAFSTITGIQWSKVPAKVGDWIMPEWAKMIPGYVNILQRELSMAPGSLADEIWEEANDPSINPEITKSASVRISTDLCCEEKGFRDRRKRVITKALARYLDIPEEEIHQDDVPCIAMVGSGGGLRALVAGTGSMLAATEAGLFDCVTYTAGVSGSCWLQALFNSSLGKNRFDKIVDHLKARIGIHIAYPPVALSALSSAPTNKFLLSGFVERLKGDPNADFGLVDVYGLLLAARLLVPKGEVGVEDRDLKISNQRANIEDGEYPMPIYTAVRHEVPIIEESSEAEKVTHSPSESTKEKARKEAWFQWFEITPYELFCEEFTAGIPTWAIGRKFEHGKDLPHDVESGLRVPELRLPLLLGVFGSAFCATLSHYYKEIRPLVKGLTGLGGIDEMIEGRNEDLKKVHPIDPASIPNFTYKMEGLLPETVPQSIYKTSHLQLMDAGMSNNLPIYPLLRPGRDVDILIAFDASADIKTENWLSVADGYARQRGIKGWPIGVGWPKEGDTVEKTAEQLDDAQAASPADADSKLADAKAEQECHSSNLADHKDSSAAKSLGPDDSGDLGYCTIWVGTTEERTSDSSTPMSKTVQEDWQLLEPDAGISVVYFPFLANPKVENVDPVSSDYMSTWNFVYTAQDIENVVELARRNFEEGELRVKRIRDAEDAGKGIKLDVECLDGVDGWGKWMDE
ncbi:hypothetical protein B7494_g1699 [Chlorociboria aeruginascens]|nr:hypothetical protein B7494_g1699 [Chlorociboria aeruginascens]